MAAVSAPAVPSNELLDWPKKDKRRFLHVTYHVGDLIKSVEFYKECFGMTLLRVRDVPEEEYAHAFLAFGPEVSNFAVELRYNYRAYQYVTGTGWHLAIATDDVYYLLDKVKAKGGTVISDPAPVISDPTAVYSGSTLIAFVKDPDGYLFKIIQRTPTQKQLFQVMLNVRNLGCSIEFYRMALGMKLLEITKTRESTIAMMGYAPEHETTVLELADNYGVTEYTKGDADVQIAISTNDVYKSAEVVNHVTEWIAINTINTERVFFWDPDGWKMELVDNYGFLKELEMAKRKRLLRVTYHVGDLLKSVKFYKECFGMTLLRMRDVYEEDFSHAFLSFGYEDSDLAVELKYNYRVEEYDFGTGWHLAIVTHDVHHLVRKVKAKGGTVISDPAPVDDGSVLIAFVKDPDGSLFEIIQPGTLRQTHCHVILRVGDLQRSIKFYEKALGMKLLKTIERPESIIAMMGYAPEHETTVLELTYNYGVTEYTKGDAYAQIAISTNDVYESAEVVNHVTQELGSEITCQAGLLPGSNSEIASFLDPDGWEMVLVDNQDFLMELMGAKRTSLGLNWMK